MMRIAGRWRITQADLWDCGALNIVAPAFIAFAEAWVGQLRLHRRPGRDGLPRDGAGRAAGCGVLLGGQR